MPFCVLDVSTKSDIRSLGKNRTEKAAVIGRAVGDIVKLVHLETLFFSTLRVGFPNKEETRIKFICLEIIRITHR